MFFKKIQKSFGANSQAFPLAIVDIGSNSVRLVVYEALKRSPAIIFNEKVLCGLGRDIMVNGLLPEDAVKEALIALKRFCAIAKQLKATQTHVIATAAVRDAKNSDAFIKPAQEICGRDIDIISGEQEAKLAASGVISGNYDADGIVADMGGGSLELIDIKNSTYNTATTLPLGGLSLLSVAEENQQKTEVYVQTELSQLDWLKHGKQRTLYAVGGTLRAIAKLHIAHVDYPLKMIHSYTLTPEQAIVFCNLLINASPQSLSAMKGLNKARRNTISYGAMVLQGLIENIKPGHVTFSSFGVREGLLYNLLSEQEKQKDPLLAACHDLCSLRSRSVKACYELCDWTDKLFAGLKFTEKQEEKRLRHAACLLSDIAWRLHPEYRSVHALNVIAQGAFSAINHEGRAFLALSVFFRYHGRIKTANLPEISKLLSEDMLFKAQGLGLALRIGYMISTATAGILNKTSLNIDEKQITLVLPPPHDVLYGEKLLRRLATLSEILELQYSIQHKNFKILNNDNHYGR
ncbi:MAG: exopolyphosphatase [Pseudomonadota bacterium]